MGIRSLKSSSIATGIKRSKFWDQSASLYIPEGSLYSLASFTVPSGGIASVTLPVPSGYRHLEIRGISKTTEGTAYDNQTLIRFNGDTAANYATHQIYGSTGSYTLGGNGGTAISTYQTPESGQSAFNGFIYNIQNYAATTKTKALTGLIGFDANGGASSQAYTTGSWNSTQPITSITFLPVTGSWAQNSRFSLYGIK